MIRNGYSPYFVKYGYAEHEANHLRYLAAEQMAQADNVGVWNQLVVNGTEARNYALLSVWWYLRAEVIQGYRRFKQQFPEAVIYNTRSDYQTLLELSSEASEAANVTIFTELREPRRLGSNMLIGIGAVKQPFNIFIPDVDLPERRAVLSGIMNRYVATDDVHPRRSYAYVTGRLKQYRGTPEMVVTDLQQITDYPPTS
jgi:micrococcal nuclease